MISEENFTDMFHIKRLHIVPKKSKKRSLKYSDETLQIMVKMRRFII